ncbi:MAG: hypothetical protein ACXQS8_09220 [Candidatus Helarchaeales archaeon]
MRKQVRIFLFIGIPLFILFVIFTIVTYMIMTIFMILLFAGIAISTFRKKNFYMRFTQFAIFWFILFFFLFPNPLDWGNQFIRRVGKATAIPGMNVIEPDKCAALEEQFWQFTNRSDMLGIDNFSAFISHPKLPTLQSQLQFVQDFLYNVTNLRLDPRNESFDGLIKYSYDWWSFPRLAYDHIPTVDEVLSRNTDDCDGIAVVTCSLLERLNIRYSWNISPFIAESDFHWWTIVFNGTSTVPVIGTEVIRLNWWTSAGDPYYVFNRHGQIYFPFGFVLPAISVILDGYVYDDFYVSILNGEEYGPIMGILAWPLLFVLLFLLSFLISYYLMLPSRWKPKKEDLYNILFGGVTLSVAATILFFACNFITASAGTIIVFVAFTTIIACMNEEYPKKLVQRLKSKKD